MKVLVTGSSGFVGRAFLHRVISVRDVELVAAARRTEPNAIRGVTYASVGDLGDGPDWRQLLEDVDVVVHLAARVHSMKDAVGALAQYRRVNVAGTLRLAKDAAATGVRRFVFLSSIKVNGESTLSGQAFRPDDHPMPVDPYGISKLEAENELRRTLGGTNTELAIIRPGLIYGPGVRANFLAMMRWVHRGIPLPVGNIKNRRSLLAIDNAVDLIWRCCLHPAAPDQVWLAADGEDLSTTELVVRLGQAMNKRVRLYSVPSAALYAAAALLGKRALAQRLLGSLQIDSSKTRDLLGWSPVVSVDRALKSTVQSFLASTCR